MEPNVLLGYLKWGIACSLSIFGHKLRPGSHRWKLLLRSFCFRSTTSGRWKIGTPPKGWNSGRERRSGMKEFPWGAPRGQGRAQRSCWTKLSPLSS